MTKDSVYIKFKNLRNEFNKTDCKKRVWYKKKRLLKRHLNIEI